ncbi:MAG TPA: SIR2 family protein [Pyrinomonadaceae bacterium]|jgi:hypothetical protein
MADFRVLTEKQIPYEVFSSLLFSKKGDQEIVPFLGAGVSVSGRAHPPAAHAQPPMPDKSQLEAIANQLKLDGHAKVFMEMAILVACHLQLAQRTIDGQLDDSELFEQLRDRESFPPSAGELARLFAQRARYTAFQRVVQDLAKFFPPDLLGASDEEQVDSLRLLSRVTGIANPPDPLTSITSYYENNLGKRGRNELWGVLSDVIAHKERPTLTHQMLAEAALHHLKAELAVDYLIITTNYDCLMEKALDELKIPYVVLATKRADQKVAVRFSEQVKDEAGRLRERNSGKYPSNFTLMKPGSMVVLYKIHGCLNPQLDVKEEGIVITDDDYVNYISQMNSPQGAIPSYVNELMRDKPFLFLGYSLSDWNVRSVFETLRKRRNPDEFKQDFSVMCSVRDYEKIFFEKNEVIILQTDLNSFYQGIVASLPEHV